MNNVLLDRLSLLSDPPVVPAPLDPQFRPAALANRAYRALAVREGATDLRVALERPDGSVSRYDTVVMRPEHPQFELSLPYAERIVKFLLWQRGAATIHVQGPAAVIAHLQSAYAPGGERAFDFDFMTRVYERPFAIVAADGTLPEARETSSPLGRHMDGNRVGLDLGASRRKACALRDGEVVYTEGTPWDPAFEPDPEYHYREILASIRTAASHLPSLESVGVSAAGVYVNNRVRVGSIFRGMSVDVFERSIAGLFLRLSDELGVPVEVANDGEVTALAGSMTDGINPVLGTALGSAQAGGYVTAAGQITNWLNELAFVPIDYRPGAAPDEWSGDCGCGVTYLSQVGGVRLAEAAGFPFPADAETPARFESLQTALEKGDSIARQAFESVGAYLGYAVAHYHDFYELKRVLVMGGVTNGEGGEIIASTARKALEREFPDIAASVEIMLAGTGQRRTGQAIAAASLPDLGRVS